LGVWCREFQSGSGTNTIRQNYSREAGLDYIVGNGGTITEAVSSMAWSGEANVHVSIVNWIKGSEKGKKRLYIQEGNNPDVGWRHSTFDTNPTRGHRIGFPKSYAKRIALRNPCVAQTSVCATVWPTAGIIWLFLVRRSVATLTRMATALSDRP